MLGTMKLGLLLLSVAAVLALLRVAATRASYGLRREFQQIVGEWSPEGDVRVLRVEELAGLPAPVQRYVRRSGAVGQPRARSFRARFRGRIRSGPEGTWMPFTGEQLNLYEPVARYFYLDATLFGVPVQVLHRYEGDSATMRVRVLGLVPMVNAAGPEMDRAETVTLLNDLSWLAPGNLVLPSIVWETIDDRSARARFTNADQTIEATLHFNDADELIDFTSDDRTMASANGREFTPAGWSTPLGAYARFGYMWLSGSGEAKWHPADGGSYTYIEMELLDVRFGERW
jgi:hypothetical protein